MPFRPVATNPTPWASPGDDELKRLLYNPQAFVMQIYTVTPHERSRTLTRLAERAVRHNAEFDVFYLLESTNLPGALRLAKAFEGRAQRLKRVQLAESARVGR